MSIVHVILTTAVFWSLAQGTSLPISSWSSAKTSVPFRRVSRAAPTINYRLPDTVVPNSYKIKIIPDMDGKEFTFNGESEINISVKKPTEKITLHARSLNITDSIHLQCNTKENPSEIFVINVLEKLIDNETEFLTIFLEKELLVGSDCNLTLSYKSTNDSSVEDVGFYEAFISSENGTNTRMVVTQFEPIYARRAFPCWDEPAFKANFIISIKHSKKYVALSNMHVTEREINLEDPTQITTYFAQSPKMSTYLVAFAVGDIASAIENDVGNFRVWARRDVNNRGKYVQEVGPKILNALENYMNSTYDSHGFKKMDIVAVPTMGRGAAMENWGLITCKESDCLLQQNSSSITKEEWILQLIIHELAHQWFGNLVTASWWNHLWITEGLATYFQYNIILDQIKPTFRMKDRFVTEFLQKVAFKEDNTGDSNHAMEVELYSPAEIEKTNRINYWKSASVIRMISHVLGEEKFQTRLRRYVKTFAFKSVTSDDLLNELAGGDQELLGFMKNWVTLPGYPVITVTRNYETETAIITQSRYLKGDNKTSTEKYWVPLNFVTEDNLDFNDTKATHWLHPSENSIQINQLNRDKLVIFNKQHFGYYRVNYDEKNWGLITDYLRTKNHNDIHVLNRVQLIHDVLHLANNNKLKYNVALNLIGYLKKESDFVVWSAAWGGIRIMNKYVENTEFAAPFQHYISHLLEGIFVKVHLNENDPMTRLYRDKILFLACYWKSELCPSEEGSREFVKWLDSSAKNPEIPLPASWISCVAGQNSNQEILDQLWDRYYQEEKYDFIETLICMNITVLERNLYTTISNNGGNRSTGSKLSRVLHFFIFYAKDKGVNIVLDFMIRNYKEIIAFEKYTKTDLKRNLKALARKLKNKNQLDKLSDFIETYKDSLDHAADGALEIVQTNIDKLENRLGEFEEFFRSDM